MMRASGALLLAGLLATSASAQTPGGAAPLYTQDDLRFLSHMIAHHEQALELAALVPSRTSREEFIRFARYVDGAQRAEIDQMRALLELAADRGLRLATRDEHDEHDSHDEHDEHHRDPMPGILSRAQMDALAAASGATFERLWLEGMIFHHEGALTMGRAQQVRDFESGRSPYGIEVMVDEILVVQRAEIAKMKAWRVEWSSPTTQRAP